MPATAVSQSQDPRLSTVKNRVWNRMTAAEKLQEVTQAQGEGMSRRAACEAADVPRATIEYWLARGDALADEPEVIAFFESPAGVACLHRLVNAAHVVMTLMGDCGIRLVCTFLQLSGLDRFVASAYGSQQRVSAEMNALLAQFGEQQHKALAPHVRGKEITVCADETFPERGLCLVAQEPVSRYLLLEEYADRRDATTWNEALQRRLEGLDVVVIQSTADEAKALRRHAQDLGAHHSPDLFHCMHEIVRAMALPVHQAVKRSTEALQEARRQHEAVVEARQRYEQGPRRRGRPPDFAKRLEQSQRAVEQAEAAEQQAIARQKLAREAWTKVSSSYHPYVLETGTHRSPEELHEQLTDALATLDVLAEDMSLSDVRLRKLAKARRLVPQMVETQRFYERTVERRIQALELPLEQEELLGKSWIPAAYLKAVAGRAQTAEDRNAHEAVAQRLVAEAEPVPATLSSEESALLATTAEDCAAVFQRSSSCVEGRNSRLALAEHARRRVSPTKLEALTVVHNFARTGADGLTPAERFFGVTPANLFDFLCTYMKLPSRPATKRHRPRKQSIFKPAE